MTSEKTIEQYFCKKVREKRGLALKLCLFQGGGFPDRTVIFPNGHICFVEFKSETGRLSKLQKFWQKKLTAYGFRYYVCKSMREAELTAKAEFCKAVIMTEMRICIFCGKQFEEPTDSEWFCCIECRKEKYGEKEK